MTDQRLLCAASMVRAGGVLADIGTDHAHLPVWLIQNGICQKAIAADIGEGPAASARRTVQEAGLSECIEVRVGDGLSVLSPEEATEIVIAGMGGETVISILEACPWTRNKKLIIQPQSKLLELRSWMNGHGFIIVDAELVYDTGRIYLVWTVCGGEPSVEEEHFFVDRVLIEKKDPLLPSYLDGLIKRELKILKGMEKGAKVGSDELAEEKSLIEELKRIKEETETW